MIRFLLAGTALAVLATTAFAQSSSEMSMSSSMMDSSMMSSSAPADSSMMDSSMMSSSTMDSSMTSSSMMDSSMASSSVQPRQPVDILSGYTRVDSDQLATKILGAAVFDSTAADANNLGKINDLILNNSGEVAAVVLGVGGFLGLGEKQVAVDFRALQWTVATDNTERWVLKTTKDELTSAPDFQAVDDTPDQPASGLASDAMAPASSSAM